LEKKQRKLSDEILFKKIQENQMNNVNYNDFNSDFYSKKTSSNLNSVNTNTHPDYLNSKNKNNINFNRNDKCKENSLNTETHKTNLVKILNETSLNTNLVNENGIMFNNDLNDTNNTMEDININRNNYLGLYSASRLWKIIKIMFMYLFQFLKKHKARISFIILIFVILKRKTIFNFIKKIIGN